MQCYGLYRGQVVSNKDPLERRRIKVKVPAITGESPSAWAWPMETSSVKTDPPAVGQGVWVLFENGDPAYPIWTGVFGKVVDTKEHLLVSPSNVSGDYISKNSFIDGRTELDLIATINSMNQKLEDLESRVSQNETDIAGKADSGHSHPGL